MYKPSRIINALIPIRATLRATFFFFKYVVLYALTYVKNIISQQILSLQYW